MDFLLGWCARRTLPRLSSLTGQRDLDPAVCFMSIDAWFPLIIYYVDLEGSASQKEAMMQVRHEAYGSNELCVPQPIPIGRSAFGA